MFAPSKRQKTLALVIALLAVPAIACGGSSAATEVPTVKTATPQVSESSNSTTTEATTAPQATDVPAEPAKPTEEPTQEVAKPVETFLGDVVELDGVFISAVNVEDPATPGLLYKEEAGKKLVAVELILGNVSADNLSVNPLYATLLDSEGYAYEAQLGGRDGQISSLDLGEGERVRGWISFQVPNEAKVSSVKYKPGLMSDNTLQASLTTPPSDHTATTESTPRTAPQLPKLGDQVELNGISLTATRVDDPAEPGVLYKAQDGKRLVGVEIALGNQSDEKVSANPLYFYLVDSQGFVYTAELGAAKEQIDTLELAKGEKVKGVIAFVVPSDAILESIKYAPTFTNNVIQTGLSQ